MTDLPTPQELRVATDVLRRDAAIWDQESARLAIVAAAAAGLEFGRTEAGLFQLLVGPYNEIITAVSRRAREGADAMTQVGQTLRMAADVYEAEDDNNAHRIRDIY